MSERDGTVGSPHVDAAAGDTRDWYEEPIYRLNLTESELSALLTLAENDSMDPDASGSHDAEMFPLLEKLRNAEALTERGGSRPDGRAGSDREVSGDVPGPSASPRSVSADGPTIYAQLMDKAIKRPHEAIVNELRGYFAATERALAQRLHELLSGAYTEGVRDGFHEGLAAAEAREDTFTQLARDLEFRLLLSDDAHTGDETPDGCDDDECVTCSLVARLAALAAPEGDAE